MVKALVLVFVSSGILINSVVNLHSVKEAESVLGAGQANANRFVTNQKDITTIKISVVNEAGTPVSNAKLTIWGIAFTPHPKPDDLVDKWVRLGEGKTDSAGELRFSFSNSGITSVQIDAIAENELTLAGTARTNKWNLKQGTPVKVIVVPSKEFQGRLVDYERQTPVASAQVQLFAGAKNRVDWISTGKTVRSDANGHFSFPRLVANSTYRVQVSHPDFHRFDGYDLTFKTRFKQGQFEPTISLLSNVTYRRIMDSARLSMPDVKGLPASTAFQMLSNRFDADQAFHEQIVSQDVQLLKQASRATKRDPFQQFMVRTRILPTDLYRDAMLELAGKDGSSEVQYQALAWLADSTHSAKHRYGMFRLFTSSFVTSLELKNARNPQENQNTALELVNRFVENGMLADDLMPFIRNNHPNPIKALTRVLNNHPNRVAQASAAVELGNHLSFYNPKARATSIISNVDQRQLQERQIWDLVIDKYDDVKFGALEMMAGETATKKIEFLDNFGVGGQAPPFSGTSMSGETVRLEDYDGKLTVFHFCRNQRLEIYEHLRFLKDKYPDSIRLLGVAYYGRQNAEGLLARNHVDWPVILDPRPNGISPMRYGGTPPLMWGTEDILGMENFETFVIDKTGKILAVGLSGAELEVFVAEYFSN